MSEPEGPCPHGPEGSRRFRGEFRPVGRRALRFNYESSLRTASMKYAYAAKSNGTYTPYDGEDVAY